MKNFFKTITALVLSAAILSPLGDMPLSVSSAYAAEIAGEHICDEHCGGEIKSLEPEEYSAGTLAAPTASKKSGTVSCTADSASIKLTAAKGTIYYSLNGASYKKYTSAIKLTKNSTIKAYAQSGSTKSETVTYTYKLLPKVTFDVSDTASGKLVKLSTKVSGVKLYYTTDSSKPTTKSKAYTSSGITITKTCKLRVLAVKSGWTDANFTKNYTVKSSTGSGSSTDTKQLGASGFTAPDTGKATVRYNGSTKTYSASQSAGHSDTYNVDYDWFKVDISSDKYVSFTIAAGAKFNTGNTLTLSDMNGLDKGSGYVTLKGFDLRSADSYTFSNTNATFYDKIELKAVDVDYTGKNPSTIYFYILAHDESGKKMSVEGLAKVNIKDSKHNGSGSTGTSSSSTDTKQLGASGFTTPSAGKATVRYNGSTKTYSASHSASRSFAEKVDYDAFSVNISSDQSVFLFIAADAKFSTGNTLTLSNMNGLAKGSGYVSLKGFDLKSDKSNVYSSNNATFYDKIELKAVDMDYTGAKPSTIYFYILAHDESGKKTSVEGLVKVNIKNSKHTGSGSGTGSGSTGTGSGTGTSSSTTDTKQLGEDSFTTPTGGKGTVRYKGSTNGVFVSTDADDDCDKFSFNAAAGKTAEFNIASGAEFNTGDTLKLSDLSGMEKGSGYVSLSGFGVRSSGDFISTDNDADYFDKVELKAVSVDYTGTEFSQFYFYILAHDESGNKISLEGLVKIKLTNSKHNTAENNADNGNNAGNGVREKCHRCFGTKRCPYCDGRAVFQKSCTGCNKTGKCKYCNGTGFELELNEKTCRDCDGRGWCKKCGGDGVSWNSIRQKDTACKTCGGSGVCSGCGGRGSYA